MSIVLQSSYWAITAISLLLHVAYRAVLIEYDMVSICNAYYIPRDNNEKKKKQ